MESVARIRVAWALRKANLGVEQIAYEVERHRSTVYRWIGQIELYGLEEYIRRYKRAKKGRRVGKTHPYVEQRVLSLRREYRGCCGEKLVYLLSREGVHVSRSTVYRILRKHLELRKHHRRAQGAPIQQATRPHQVVQMDTLVLGEVYAYTAIDTFTREARIVMRPSLQAEDGRIALEAIMPSLGPCELLQTDGGSEFKAACAEKMYLYAQRHRIARPYKKNEQAFIEAFHSTLRREEFGRTPFKAADLEWVQQRAAAFLEYYHHKRPHMSLGMRTPAQFAESHLP
jgi:transposase InsO family protein